MATSPSKLNMPQSRTYVLVGACSLALVLLSVLAFYQVSSLDSRAPDSLSDKVHANAADALIDKQSAPSFAPHTELAALSQDRQDVAARSQSWVEAAPESVVTEDSVIDDMRLEILASLDLKALLLPDLFNHNTLDVAQRMFMALDANIENLNEHLLSAEVFLSSQLDNPADVASLMSFYRRFTEFELAQAIEPAPLWQEAPQDMAAAVALNEAKQEYRRNYFGRDIADRVWGPSLNDANYHQRMLALVRDDDFGDDTALRADLIKQLPNAQAELQVNDADDPEEPGDLARINPHMYIKLVRNGEALLAMDDDERRRMVQSFWRETAAEIPAKVPD